MRITLNPVLDIETLEWVSNDGVYEYSGPMDEFCSSGGSVAAQDKELMAAQTTAVNSMNADYATTFAENQSVANSQIARANAMMSNPMGYSAPQLAAATTSINENTATAAKQAIGSAAAFAASHGSSDIGGGSIGAVAGQIGSEAAQSKAQQLSSLSQQDQAMKREQMMAGLSELNNAGANLSGQSGTAISGAGESADSAVKAGSGELAAQQAGWSDIGGVLNGIGGLVTAGASIPGVHV